jgi:hypothetical protein
MSSLSRPSVLLFVAGAALTLAASAGCNAPSSAAAAPPAPPVVSEAPTPSEAPDEDNGSAPPPQPQPKPTSTKSAPPPAWPTNEDCISYNPANLTVSYENEIFTVTDGATVVARVHGGQGSNTGDKALALAQRYKKHCFLGRDNTREDKNEYVFDYWRSLSGMNTTIPDQEEDCSPYDRHNLTVEDMGNGYGWRVKDHDHVLHLFDNESDARNGKLVLSKYSQICSIGFTDDGRDSVSYSL